MTSTMPRDTIKPKTKMIQPWAPSRVSRPMAASYGERIAIRDFAGDGPRVSEMDALVAYLQMLGTLVDFESFQASIKSPD